MPVSLRVRERLCPFTLAALVRVSKVRSLQVRSTSCWVNCRRVRLRIALPILPGERAWPDSRWLRHPVRPPYPPPHSGQRGSEPAFRGQSAVKYAVQSCHLCRAGSDQAVPDHQCTVYNSSSAYFHRDRSLRYRQDLAQVTENGFFAQGTFIFNY